jgi:CRP-like cAMP-binding protein
MLDSDMSTKDLDKSKALTKMADILEPLNEKQRALLTDHLTLHVYKRNENIYTEGEIPSQLMCLLTGKVKIFKNGAGGRNQIMRIIKPVEYFAYRAHFAEEEFVTSAAAFETSTIGMIPMSIITKLIQENSCLAWFFIKQLSKDLGIADERTVNLTQKHIRGRLAESLLFLKESYGVEEDGCTLSIYLSREDLANLSNMTTSNAIRTLSNFAAEKVIAIDGRKIKIISEKALMKISQIG